MISEIQNKIFDISLTYKNICQKHNLRYFICGGSCLGAIRHKGFIPWDDDMDFAMPREDYEKFLKVAPHELQNTQYALRDFSIDGKGHSFCFAKLDDTTTTFIEQSLSNFYHRGGVYIDIFPLDGTFDSKVLQKIHIFLISRLVKLREIAFIAKIKPEKGVIYNSVLKIVRKMCRGKTLYSIIHLCLTLKKYHRAQYVGNLVWGYGQKEIMQKAIYEPARYIEFEGCFFASPAQSHIYLQQIYGNYMQLPPEEDRKSQHPTFFYDLNLSYRVYKYV